MSTAPVLPVPLTPLVCLLQSKDLSDALSDRSLPPLHQILQTFSPLQQVTARSTTFSTITHPSFHLRFADLSPIESACAEDEDERASRTIDWIGQRITSEADGWVKSVEKPDKDGITRPSHTPWWRELQVCVEGDHVPTRFEGWNHPVAVILAVSTLAPNPLQAVTELHSRYKDIRLPAWVDSTRLCHTLIIHPTESPLNSDEAMALYNATKKQYGLHTHMLAVTLESPAEPISLPSPLPELPPSPLIETSKTRVGETWDLNLTETDVQQFGRFVREFTTMSLVPWMERCVLDWNESYIATRRLPSRLFSTTKRFFGGSNTSSVPSSPVIQSPSSLNGFHATITPSSLPQHRRLAEFATFLGDVKLATSVWETLRKDGKSGAEVLPFLIAPTQTITAHAMSALAALQAAEFRSSHQLQALYYAVRWASGICEFESLGGERWLEMAAGSIEEPPFALLLGEAALFSLRKGALRRAAMWYAIAAHRLEKCGVKPLTAHFLRKALDLYQSRPAKNLSPSFEASLLRKEIDWFDAILPSVEYSLGRLTYSSGDTEGALRYFIKLLKGSKYNQGEYDLTDSVYIGDFKVAFEHLNSTLGTKSLDLIPPFKLSQPSECKIRLAQDQMASVSPVWESFEQAWSNFWKTKGKERLDMDKKASVGERFYVDVVLTNPFDVTVPLSAVTVDIETTGENQEIEKEVLDEITLQPRETRMISLYAICHHTGTIKITNLTYNFLSLLHVSEPLSVNGPRLHQTMAQQRSIMYGPNTFPTIQIQEDRRRLDISLNRNSTNLLRKFVLGTGECADMKITLRNAGHGEIDDIWILHSSSVWLNLGQTASKPSQTSDAVETIQSSNALVDSTPRSIPLELLHGSPRLKENEMFDIPCIVHADQSDSQDLFILVIFRQRNQPCFFSSKLHQTFRVNPILECGIVARPSHRLDISYEVLLEIRNVSETSNLTISQITCASPNWQCTSDEWNSPQTMSSLSNLQIARLFFLVGPSEMNEKSFLVEDMTIHRLSRVLHDNTLDSAPFPPIDISFSHLGKSKEHISANSPGHLELLQSSWRDYINDHTLYQFRKLFPNSFDKLLPLWNPREMNIIIYWEIPEENRQGFVTLPGINLGASSAPLERMLQDAEADNVKRILYAESSREKALIQSIIRTSEWNAEMNPLMIHAMTESPRVSHDFSQGECTVTVSFVIRNFSLTHYARFVLRLPSHNATKTSEVQNMAPCYTGLLTRRGTLRPRESVTVQTKIWTTAPGIYGLDGWKLETEVGGKELEPWNAQAHYVQEVAPNEGNSVIIVQHP